MLNKPADQDGAGVALPEIRPAFAVLFLAFLYLTLSNRVELVQHLGNWHDQQRFLQLLLLAFVALATAIYPPAGMPRTAIVLLGLALASGLTAAQPGWAFAEVAVFLGLILTVYWCRIAFRGALQVDPQPLMLGLLV
ncbi:MAG: hypothetical protein VW257_08810, partial [Quisquiliibacterium sp.]